MRTEYPIDVFYSDEDEVWIADIPELDACSAFGETPEEALAEVQKAKHLWLETARDTGQPIPPAKGLPVGTLNSGLPDLAEKHREYILESLENDD